MTPSSIEMHLEHVDGNEFVRYQNANHSPKLVEIIDQLKKRGIWKFPYEVFIAIQLMDKDVFMINTIRQIGTDGTSEASVSHALSAGRRECIELFKIIIQYFPGFSQARIRKIADYIGIRETRRIEVLGPIRVMDPCFQMGQAAGTAAFFAIDGGRNDFHTVDVRQLQSTLWGDGVINPDDLPFYEGRKNNE